MTVPTLLNNQRQKRTLGLVSAVLAAQAAGLVVMSLGTNLDFRNRTCEEGGAPKDPNNPKLKEAEALLDDVDDVGPVVAVFPPFCDNK